MHITYSVSDAFSLQLMHFTNEKEKTEGRLRYNFVSLRLVKRKGIKIEPETIEKL